MNLTLPWPPSINTYWRRRGPRYFVADKGVEFRYAVIGRAIEAGRRETMMGNVSLWIVAHPPDNRRRDIDNILKPILDGLKHAGVYGDDSQVKRLAVEWRDVVDEGCVDVAIDPMGEVVSADPGAEGGR